jgi:hypothetical protein
MSDKPPPKHTEHGNYRRADWFEARCAQLETALRTANEDFKACWIATGNPEALAALKRTEVALGLTVDGSGDA